MSRTIAMEVPEIALGERWVITKAGTEGAWLPGWFAYAPHADSGAWFPTYDEARLFVASQVDQAVERARFADSLARWGVDRQQRAQGGADQPRRSRTAALTADELTAIRDLRTTGMSGAAIAKAIGRSQPTVSRYLHRWES